MTTSKKVNSVIDWNRNQRGSTPTGGQPMTKTCAQCGDAYMPKCNAQQFCSANCQLTHAVELKRLQRHAFSSIRYAIPQILLAHMPVTF